MTPHSDAKVLDAKVLARMRRKMRRTQGRPDEFSTIDFCDRLLAQAERAARLDKALRDIVEHGIANRGTPSEFIYNTGLHACDITKAQRRKHPTWRRWDAAVAALKETP